MKTALLLIACLIFASLQCVTACAKPCEPAPCHHQDKQSQAVCSHELVVDRSAAQLEAAETAPVPDPPAFIEIEHSTPAKAPAQEVELLISPPLRI